MFQIAKSHRVIVKQSLNITLKDRYFFNEGIFIGIVQNTVHYVEGALPPKNIQYISKDIYAYTVRIILFILSKEFAYL